MKFDPQIHTQSYLKHKLKVLTHEKLSNELDISPMTLHRWIKAYEILDDINNSIYDDVLQKSIVNSNNFVIYILKTETNLFYVGRTEHFFQRMEQHTAGTNGTSLFTKEHLPFQVKHMEGVSNFESAKKKENEWIKFFKRLNLSLNNVYKGRKGSTNNMMKSEEVLNLTHDDFKRLYDEYKSVRQIAQKLETTSPTVKKYMLQVGFTKFLEVPLTRPTKNKVELNFQKLRAFVKKLSDEQIEKYGEPHFAVESWLLATNKEGKRKRLVDDTLNFINMMS